MAVQRFPRAFERDKMGGHEAGKQRFCGLFRLFLRKPDKLCLWCAQIQRRLHQRKGNGIGDDTDLPANRGECGGKVGGSRRAVGLPAHTSFPAAGDRKAGEQQRPPGTEQRICGRIRRKRRDSGRQAASAWVLPHQRANLF